MGISTYSMYIEYLYIYIYTYYVYMGCRQPAWHDVTNSLQGDSTGWVGLVRH